jgi:hypothetical protein
MSLLYFHSPLPPAESGIADYAFEILAQLKNLFDVAIAVGIVGRSNALAEARQSLSSTQCGAICGSDRRGIDIYYLGRMMDLVRLKEFTIRLTKNSAIRDTSRRRSLYVRRG